jgi:TonB family protein
MGRVFVLIFLSLSLAPRLPAQTAENPSYPDSAEGFRQQLEDLIATKKSGDAAGFRIKLETLAIPNAQDWIVTHFSATDVTNLGRDYRLRFAKFQENLASLIERVAQTPGREMMVWSMEPPVPPDAILAKQGLPSTVQPTMIRCFLYGFLSEENTIPQTSVSSVVYLEGEFRYAGGMFPFWWDALNRGAVSGSQLIHRVNPKYPKEARKQHIEGVVRIFAITGKDGMLHDLKLVKGDPLLSEAALKAVQQWRYQPGLLGGVPVEIETTIDVRFQLNQKD